MAAEKRSAPEDAAPALTFAWIRRDDHGFSRRLARVINTEMTELECDRGDQGYWTHVFDMATRRDQTSVAQPFLYLVLMESDKTLMGFCLIRLGKHYKLEGQPQTVYDPHAWYLEFLCARKGLGLGKALMTEIHRTAVSFGIRYISLSALPEVIMFYHQLGYKLTLNLDCMESPEIAALAAHVRQEIERRKREKLHLPKNLEEMLTDEPFNQLLIASFNAHLDTGRLRGDECKSAAECVGDGVHMVLCLPRQHMEVGPTQSFYRDTLANLPAKRTRGVKEPNFAKQFL